MDKGMNFIYILSGPLGYVMEWIYKLLPSYGWDIILFTLLINIGAKRCCMTVRHCMIGTPSSMAVR